MRLGIPDLNFNSGILFLNFGFEILTLQFAVKFYFKI